MRGDSTGQMLAQQMAHWIRASSADSLHCGKTKVAVAELHTLLFSLMLICSYCLPPKGYLLEMVFGHKVGVLTRTWPILCLYCAYLQQGLHYMLQSFLPGHATVSALPGAITGCTTLHI